MEPVYTTSAISSGDGRNGSVALAGDTSVPGVSAAEARELIGRGNITVEPAVA